MKTQPVVICIKKPCRDVIAGAVAVVVLHGDWIKYVQSQKLHLIMSNLFGPPLPPCFKVGEAAPTSPFCKGGLRGIFVSFISGRPHTLNIWLERMFFKRSPIIK